MDALSASVLEALVRKQARKSALPSSLIHAVIEKESGGRPAAIGDSGAAMGLMQVHPAAAEEAGYSHAELADPEKAVDAGASYLSAQLARFGGPHRALSAYNAGPGRTRAAGGVHPAAAGYVEEVTGRAAELAPQYADEATPLSDTAAAELPLSEVLDRDRVVRILRQLLGSR